MRIAQVAPLYESCPPQLYGGTERVVFYLTEELVRQGHEVTLFASGDSQTDAILRAPCECALRLKSAMSGSATLPSNHVEQCRAQRRAVRHHPFPHRSASASTVRPASEQDTDNDPRRPCFANFR